MALPSTEKLAEVLKGLLVQVNPSAEAWLTDSQVNLFEVGALDSILIVEFIQSFERQLDIVFNFTDFRAAYFQTIDSVITMLNEKYS
jgi:acyl carrier protein